MKQTIVSFILNGDPVEFATEPNRTLLESLREELGLTGTKHGCELGECGACTVLLDGRPVLSCLTLTIDCRGRDVVTIEGMADGATLNPLQEALADLGATQCGYCTPGIVMAATALLEDNPSPRREEIARGLAGNLCRCTGYHQILDAVEAAASRGGKRS